MNFVKLVIKYAVITVILLLPLSVTFADGCDDLVVTIDNNTGLTVNGYYTENSLGEAPVIKVVKIPAYTRNFDLPQVVNKMTLPLVYTDIILRAEAQQNWLDSDNFKTKADMPLHDKVISITKYYTPNGIPNGTMNFIATECQRIKRHIYDSGDRNWVCDNDMYRDTYNITSQARQTRNREPSSTESYDSSTQDHFKVTAELLSYGYCANKPGDIGQPGKVVIHITSL